SESSEDDETPKKSEGKKRKSKEEKEEVADSMDVEGAEGQATTVEVTEDMLAEMRFPQSAPPTKKKRAQMKVQNPYAEEDAKDERMKAEEATAAKEELEDSDEEESSENG